MIEIPLHYFFTARRLEIKLRNMNLHFEQLDFKLLLKKLLQILH